MEWRRFFRRRRSDAELQQEIELHLAEEIGENLERGVSAEEARRQAYVKFGSPRRVREEVWRQGTVSVLDSLMRDLSQAFRRLAKSPSTVLTIVLSLGLGIAANVVIFSAVNKLVLQGPPVGNPATLLDIYPTYEHGQRLSKSSMRMYDDVHDEAKSFSGVAAYDIFLPATLGGQGEPERVWGQSATTNFFDVAQLPMTLGRGFHSDEDRSPVTVLSYGLWRRRFNGDTGIVGKTISLSGKMFTVIGVTARGFRGIDRLIDGEFWVPFGEREQLAAEQMGDRLCVTARLKPGVSLEQAEAELNTLAQRFAIAYPTTDKGLGFHLQEAGTLLPTQRAMFAVFLTALTVVALLVLCIAGSNVANLLLVRAAARHREMAVRIALGATRFQLIRPMLLESTLLALGGGLFGVGLCVAGLRGLTAFHLPMAVPLDLSLNVDWRVMLYAFLLSVGAGLLCGIGPAFSGSRPALPSSLKGESAMERPGRRWSLRNILVVLQVSLCVVLLCTMGLFLRSLQKSAGAETGFRSSGLLMASIDPVHNGYTPAQTRLLMTRLRERVAGLPGAMSVACTDMVPLSQMSWGSQFHVASSAGNAELDPRADIYEVTAGYFNTMGIPRVAGSDLNATDPNGPKQAVVNEAFVQRLFGGRNAIGERVASHVIYNGTFAQDATYEIVGVVKNAKSRAIRDPDGPILYSSLEQNVDTQYITLGFSLLVHYSGDAAQLATAVRNEIHAVDPQLAVFDEKTIEEHMNDALILPRVAAIVFGIFGFAGLLLATVGLYGVISYSVSSRTREIGIRLALGATHGGVQRLVVRQGMLLSCVAMAIGLPLALAAAKVAAGALYGIAPNDWVTFTGTPAFLAAVTLIACWIPARRAATVEPQTALRHE
jgi:predicted permease